MKRINIHLVHSEKFHVLNQTLNTFCHKPAMPRRADNAFCAKTLSVQLSITWRRNTARNSIFTFQRTTRLADKNPSRIAAWRLQILQPRHVARQEQLVHRLPPRRPRHGPLRVRAETTQLLQPVRSQRTYSDFCP